MGWIFIYTKPPLWLCLQLVTSVLQDTSAFLLPPHLYWLNNSSEVRFAPQVTLLASALAHTVLGTGTDTSLVAEMGAPAL